MKFFNNLLSSHVFNNLIHLILVYKGIRCVICLERESLNSYARHHNFQYLLKKTFSNLKMQNRHPSAKKLNIPNFVRKYL